MRTPALLSALTLSATLLGLGGCGHLKPVDFTGPDGRQAYMFACSGAFKTMDTCKQEADRYCPAGYDLIDRPANVPGLQHAAGGMYFAPDKMLTVQCKAA